MNIIPKTLHGWQRIAFVMGIILAVLMVFNLLIAGWLEWSYRSFSSLMAACQAKCDAPNVCIMDDNNQPQCVS